MAVEAGELTAEHVPSKSLGGKELILTCAHCNHVSGSRIESHASKKENLEGLGGGGQLTRPTRVHIKGGDHRVSATLLQWDEKRIHLELPPLEKHANNPREVARAPRLYAKRSLSETEVQHRECAILSWKLKRLPTPWFDDVGKNNIKPQEKGAEMGSLLRTAKKHKKFTSFG